MYIAKYRESLKRESINYLLGELWEITELEDAYANDLYISREIEQASDYIDQLEEIIEYLINFKYSVNEL